VSSDKGEAGRCFGGDSTGKWGKLWVLTAGLTDGADDPQVACAVDQQSLDDGVPEDPLVSDGASADKEGIAEKKPNGKRVRSEPSSPVKPKGKKMQKEAE
jgi:hypothetical protein